MSLVLIISLGLRLLATAWVLALFTRVKDCWTALLVFVFGLTVCDEALEIVLKWQGAYILPSGQIDEWISLSMSGVALVIGVALGRAYVENRNTLAGLQESERRYRSLFQDSKDVVYMTSQDGTIVEVNQAGLDLFGYDADEVRRINVAQVYARPEERAVFQERMARDGYVKDYEVQLKRKDGTVVDCLLTAAVRRGPAGRVLGYHGIVRDVTELKKAQRALRESEERFRLIAQQSLVGIYMIRNGCLEFVNDAYVQFGGRPRDQLVGRGMQGMLELVHPDDRELVREQIVKKSRGDPDAKASYEFRFLRPDGEVRTLQLYSRHVEHEYDQIILGVLVDVTERKRAEEERARLEAQMRHAQKLESLGVLAGGIAHDFNNLLVGILGNASFIFDDLPEGSSTRQSVAHIIDAAERAAELVREMLAYSGRGHFLVEPVNLSVLTRDMAHLLESSISKRAVLEYALEEKLPNILADAAQMRQIIMNLLTNASEAVEDSGGTIRLSTGVIEADRQYLLDSILAEELPEGQYVFVEVADSGVGIEPRLLPRIFEPFYSTKFTGRGLGLAAVLGIVRGHKGAIKVTSRPGNGSVFRVLFPVHEDPAAIVPVASVGSPVSEMPSPTGWVLVVDDEEIVRSIARRILEREGFRVLLARDGEEGLEVFRAEHERLHAVVLDLTMPKLGGEEVFKRMRAINPRVPVLLSSGYDEQEVVGRLDHDGLAGFVQKPYRAANLLAKLRRALP